MTVNWKRVAILSALTFVPAAAFAAAAVTGVDGGMAASLLDFLTCSGGCPNS